MVVHTILFRINPYLKYSMKKSLEQSKLIPKNSTSGVVDGVSIDFNNRGPLKITYDDTTIKPSSSIYVSDSKLTFRANISETITITGGVIEEIPTEVPSVLNIPDEEIDKYTPEIDKYTHEYNPEMK